MPECHRCKVAAHIAEGKYSRTPFLRTPCAKCNAGKEGSHGGQTFIRYVDNLNGELDGAIGADDPSDLPPPPDRFGALAYLLKMLCGLPPKTRDIVMIRIAYPSMPVKAIAKRFGIGVSATNEAIHRGVARCHAMHAAFPIRTWAWKNRKPRPRVEA